MARWRNTQMKLKIFTVLLSLLCGRKERGGGENKKQEQREKIKGKKKGARWKRRGGTKAGLVEGKGRRISKTTGWSSITNWWKLATCTTCIYNVTSVLGLFHQNMVFFLNILHHILYLVQIKSVQYFNWTPFSPFLKSGSSTDKWICQHFAFQ